jgi:hypothetical protein
MPPTPIARIPVLKISAQSTVRRPSPAVLAGQAPTLRPLSQVLQQLGAQQAPAGTFTLTVSKPFQPNRGYLQFWNAKWIDSLNDCAVLGTGGGVWVCIQGPTGRYVVQCSVIGTTGTHTFTIEEGTQSTASIQVAQGQSLLCVFDLQPEPAPSIHYISISCQDEVTFFSCEITPLNP